MYSTDPQKLENQFWIIIFQIIAETISRKYVLRFVLHQLFHHWIGFVTHRLTQWLSNLLFSYGSIWRPFVRSRKYINKTYPLRFLVQRSMSLKLTGLAAHCAKGIYPHPLLNSACILFLKKKLYKRYTLKGKRFNISWSSCLTVIFLYFYHVCTFVPVLICIKLRGKKYPPSYLCT